MIKQIHDLVCPTKKIYQDGNNYQVKWRNSADIKYLDNLNIKERKTYDVKMPIFQNNMWHFIRGVFDGDGCVYNSTTLYKKYNKKYTYQYITFTTASLKFANELNNLLQQNNIRSKVYLDKRIKEAHKNPTYYVKILHIPSVYIFKQLIYDNCKDWRLERKYEKFNSLL